MNKPMLQVALDTLDIPSALEATQALAAEVDVLEVILGRLVGVGRHGAVRSRTHHGTPVTGSQRV